MSQDCPLPEVDRPCRDGLMTRASDPYRLYAKMFSCDRESHITMLVRSAHAITLSTRVRSAMPPGKHMLTASSLSDRQIKGQPLA